MGANLPNGADGIDAGSWLAPWMNSGADLSKLGERTLENVQEFYKLQVQNEAGWNEASNVFFQLILGGFQNLEEFARLIVQAITGTPGALGDLTTFFAERWADLAAAFTAVGALIDGIAGEIGSSLEDAVEKLSTFLTSLSPLNALNLFGQVGAGQLPLLPLSSIGNTSPELMVNGGFDTDVSIKGNPDFTWDGTVGRSALGSARCVAGGLRTLVSNAVGVVPGEELPVSAWTRYTGVTAVAGQNGIQLAVSGYSVAPGGAKTLVSTTTVAAIASPSGTQSTWQQLSGVYEVPEGVDQVVVELVVNGSVSAGTVWFDDVSLKKNPGFRLEWVQGLQAWLTGLGADFQSLIDNTWHAIFGEWDPGKGIEDFFYALQHFPKGNVEGLEDALSDLLGLDQWQEFLNAIKGGTGGVVNDLVNKLKWLTSGGLFDAAKLTNANNIVELPGTKVTGTETNIVADFQKNIDNLVNQLFGGPTSGTVGQTLADSAEALKSLKQTVLGLSQDIADIKIKQMGETNSGQNFRVDFTKLPVASDFSTAPFDVTYQGTGTGRLRVNGQAEWVKVADGDRIALARYTGGVTDTDYQLIQATVSGPPDVGANNWACGRMSLDKTTFVYARGYRAGVFGLGFKAELGCYVAGVQHVFLTDIPATYNYNLQIRIGVGGSPYRIQVLSGSTVVADYTDTAHVSALGANYRGWGFLSSTGNSGNAAPAPAVFVGCSDNAPVAVQGSTFRAFRSLSSNVSIPVGEVPLPANLFDTVDYKSNDITWNAATNEVTITTAGTYLCTCRLEYDNLAGMGATNWYNIWYVNGVIKGYGKPTKSVGPNGFGVPATSLDSGTGGDAFIYYMPAGAKIRAGMGSTGSTNIKGESQGAYTNIQVTKIA